MHLLPLSFFITTDDSLMLQSMHINIPELYISIEQKPSFFMGDKTTRVLEQGWG
jgi:hypothetical protein